MAARRLKLGIIGTGIAARDLHWPPLRRAADQFEIVAVCNRTRRKAEAFAAMVGNDPRITTDYRELLGWQEVEAVDILLPIAMNATVTIDALRAGKHVMVEKPIAHTVQAGQHVVDEAERHAHLTLLVAENVRYEPYLREACALLQRGVIGRPVMIQAENLAPLGADNPYAQTPWRQHPAHIGGFLSDGGVHQVAALHMLGGEIDTVQGISTSFHPEHDPTDTLLVNLRFVSGAVGHLTYSVGVHRYEERPLRVYGTEGSMVVQRETITVVTDKGEERVRVSAEGSGFDAEFADFYRSITAGTAPSVTPRDALNDLLVIDSALRSSSEGVVVRLDGLQDAPP